MVECTVTYQSRLDAIFNSLADATRRDILRRLTAGAMNVGAIAEAYDLSLAAISKHLKILEKAHLVTKQRQGKQQIVQLSPTAFQDASKYLQQYEAVWRDRFDALEVLLAQQQPE